MTSVLTNFRILLSSQTWINLKISNLKRQNSIARWRRSKESSKSRKILTLLSNRSLSLTNCRKLISSLQEKSKSNRTSLKQSLPTDVNSWKLAEETSRSKQWRSRDSRTRLTWWTSSKRRKRRSAKSTFDSCSSDLQTTRSRRQSRRPSDSNYSMNSCLTNSLKDFQVSSRSSS